MTARTNHIATYKPRTYVFGAVAFFVLAVLGYLVFQSVATPTPLPDNADMSITYHQPNQTLILKLSTDFRDLPVAGSVRLRHLTDQSATTKSLPVKLRRNTIQKINVADLQKGDWKVSVFFTAGDETYYSEKTIQL